MDIKLIALDLAGTLLLPDKSLSPRNRAALTAAADRGIHIVPTTGRLFAGLPEVVRDLPFVRYAVTVNGGLEMDDGAKRVTVDGQEVALTPVEYKIVKFLMENRGLVFSSAQIYENVWNEPSYGADNIVAVHIRHIREKIEINPKEPRYIKVIWGHGYKMEKL